jgi:hypothetical protein
MAALFIKEIISQKEVGLSEAAHLLEAQAITHSINELNWKEFPYKPDVQFRIAHTRNQVWLKFYVKEKYILARETQTNGQVYKDSCVEFFISANDGQYYNFEFNGIGTTHLAYGSGRNNRKFVPPEMVEKIEIESSLGNKPFGEKSGNFEWEMMIRIPVSCFAFSHFNTFSGLKARGNFYKCGDETSQPHYITWNPIKTDQPDYHRPEFFGRLDFG